MRTHRADHKHRYQSKVNAWYKDESNAHSWEEMSIQSLLRAQVSMQLHAGYLCQSGAHSLSSIKVINVCMSIPNHQSKFYAGYKCPSIAHSGHKTPIKAFKACMSIQCPFTATLGTNVKPKPLHGRNKDLKSVRNTNIHPMSMLSTNVNPKPMHGTNVHPKSVQIYIKRACSCKTHSWRKREFKLVLNTTIKLNSMVGTNVSPKPIQGATSSLKACMSIKCPFTVYILLHTCYAKACS